VVPPATVLTVSDGTLTQDVSMVGDIIATFSGSGGGTTLTYGFTEGTNTEGYYIIDGFEVLLTSVGLAYLNQGNIMPDVSISTNTGKRVTNTVTTVLSETEEPEAGTFIWSNQWEWN
jgi:hypothetical protein